MNPAVSIPTESSSPDQSKSSTNGNIISQKIATCTPDFDAMIRIVYWNSFGFFFFGFLIPYVSSQLLNASATGVGFVFSSQLFGGLISTPIIGYLTDRMSRKKLILYGSIGRGVSYLVLYVSIFFKSVWGFSFGIFVLGFAVGFFWIPFDALISEKTSKETRSYGFGKREANIGWGNLVGSLMGMACFGFGTLYLPGNNLVIYSPLLVYAATNFYGGWLIFRNVDETLTLDRYLSQTQKLEFITPSNESESKNNKKTSSSKLPKLLITGFAVLLFAFMVSHVNQSMSKPFIQIYIIETITNNGFWIMLIFFPAEIISFLISPRMGKLADNFNPKIGIIMTSIAGATITYILIHTTIGWLFAIVLTFDAVFGRWGELILQSYLSRISKTNRGKIFGLRRWISFVGGIIGPILGGMLWDRYGRQSPFIISIFVELMIFPLLIAAISLITPFMAEKVILKSRRSRAIADKK